MVSSTAAAIRARTTRQASAINAPRLGRLMPTPVAVPVPVPLLPSTSYGVAGGAPLSPPAGGGAAPSSKNRVSSPIGPGGAGGGGVLPLFPFSRGGGARGRVRAPGAGAAG